MLNKSSHLTGDNAAVSFKRFLVIARGWTLAFGRNQRLYISQIQTTMSNDTTSQQLADLREDVSEVLSNQVKLEGLLRIIGREVFTKSGSGVDQFNGLAKAHEIKRRARK